VSSLPFQHLRPDCSLCPRALSEAPTSSLAWSPLGRLASRSAKRRNRFSSCVTAGLNPDSRLSALVGGPEGPRGEPRFLVDQLLDALPPADHALGVVPLPPQFRAVKGGCLDTCGLDPSAILRGEAYLSSEPPYPVLGVPGLLHPDLMVFLQGELGVKPDAEPSGGLRVELDRVSCHLDTWGGAAGVLRFLRLLRRIASVFSVSKATAFASAHS